MGNKHAPGKAKETLLKPETEDLEVPVVVMTKDELLADKFKRNQMVKANREANAEKIKAVNRANQKKMMNDTIDTWIAELQPGGSIDYGVILRSTIGGFRTDAQIEEMKALAEEVIREYNEQCKSYQIVPQYKEDFVYLEVIQLT